MALWPPHELQVNPTLPSPNTPQLRHHLSLPPRSISLPSNRQQNITLAKMQNPPHQPPRNWIAVNQSIQAFSQQLQALTASIINAQGTIVNPGRTFCSERPTFRVTSLDDLDDILDTFVESFDHAWGKKEKGEKPWPRDCPLCQTKFCHLLCPYLKASEKQKAEEAQEDEEEQNFKSSGL
ncbi:hypothetical protein BT63DRAFT_455588 [Microthyrium microscopicum]|uniref:Uncharacterized protein n=1 Tax=Microthyrium microscopicum TaxID=703497 RepID=A0A6A6UEU2_9PEZI|nr:hypothetical protein BT63DRAFT_455588 [Microthyrium microscopicum]